MTIEPDARAVIVHSLPQAHAALAAAAALDVPVLLLSAPAAAGSVGPLWFREMIAQALARVPRARAQSVLDCGDAPGLALAALHCGLGHVCYRGSAESAEKLRQIAEQLGATLLTERPEALDLLEEPDPPAACRVWLTPG